MSSGARAAGEFRRTAIERSDQRVSWERPDQAFFAAGACHILAWVCRETYPDRPIALTALFLDGEQHPMHVYASWESWAFDAGGWNPEAQLLTVNAEFERRAVRTVPITAGLAEFCGANAHRLPEQFWRDPRPRAGDFVSRHLPPWH